MKKQLISAASLCLVTLLSGCGNSQPTPEDAMAKEVLAVLRDELPLDATEISFDAKFDVQNCSVVFGKDYAYATIPLPQTQLPIAFAARKDGAHWDAVRNYYGDLELESQSGNPGSESISAGTFRELVRHCVQITSVRRHITYSQSIRAANALSWAQAAEDRKTAGSPDFAIKELARTQEELNRRVSDWNHRITAMPSRNGNITLTLSPEDQTDASPSQDLGLPEKKITREDAE